MRMLSLVLAEVADGHVPVWAATAAAVLTLLGGALLGFYGRWRKQNIELTADQNRVTLEGRRATTDLEIHVEDDRIAKWKAYAEEQKKRADDAEARVTRKDTEWREYMAQTVARYEQRESTAAKQMQDRELQLGELIDRLRNEYNARTDALALKHEDCVRENAKMNGRVEQLERVVSDLQDRLTAREARKEQ